MIRFLLPMAGLAILLSTTACSGVEMKRGEQARNNRDIRQGPGLLSGKSGEFVIYRVDAKEARKGEGAQEEGAADNDVPRGAGDKVIPQ